MLLARQDLLVDKVFGKPQNELSGHLHMQAVSACKCAKTVLQVALVVSDVHTWQVLYGNVGAKTLQGSNLMPEFWL